MSAPWSLVFSGWSLVLEVPPVIVLLWEVSICHRVRISSREVSRSLTLVAPMNFPDSVKASGYPAVTDHWAASRTVTDAHCTGPAPATGMWHTPNTPGFPWRLLEPESSNGNRYRPRARVRNTAATLPFVVATAGAGRGCGYGLLVWGWFCFYCGRTGAVRTRVGGAWCWCSGSMSRKTATGLR